MNCLFVVLFILLFYFVYCDVVFYLGEGEDFSHKTNRLPPEVRMNKIDSTVYSTVKRFYCSINADNDSYQLLYGSNGWRFDPQDVNLTLSYPAPDVDREYIITSTQVIMYSDSERIKGFITDGGIRQDTIRMTFILQNATNLFYQFWVNGAPLTYFFKEDLQEELKLNGRVNMCSNMPLH